MTTMRIPTTMLAIAFLWLSHAAGASAGCTGYASTNSHLSLPANLTAKRNTPVGTVIHDTGWISDGRRADVRCTGSFAWTRGFASAMTPVSGMTDVYETGVPGLGIKILYDNTNPAGTGMLMRWPRTTQNLSTSTQAAFTPWGLFRVSYIVTGPMSSGTMSTPSPTATVSYGGVLANQVTFSKTTVNIVSTGCRVLDDDIAVPLPDVAASDFTAVGARPASRDFTIDLTCDNDVAVSYQIDGTPPSGMPASNGVIAAATGAGQATGVGVQLTRSGTLVPLGAKTPYLRTTSNGQSVPIPLTASYYATALPVRGGTLSAVATFTMFYE